MHTDFWSDRRVLVTGHTGFKGAWLCLVLQRLGANVVGYALDPPTVPSLYCLANVAEGMESIIADVRDRETLGSAMDTHRPEIVFHLAAQSLVPEGYARPVETFEVNVLGTVYLLEAVRRRSETKATIVVTSDKCYAPQDLGRGYVEEDPLGGDDPYSNSKGCAELVTASYRTSFLNTGQQGIATARAGNVLGGGDWSANRLVPDVIRAAFGDRQLTLRYPHATRPWQHVLDPLAGYLGLAERLYATPLEFAEAWNFGPDPDGVRAVHEVVERLATHLGREIDVKVESVATNKESSNLLLDAAKATRKLGWSPQLDLEETLRAVASWHRGFADGIGAGDLCRAEIDAFLEKSDR